MYIGQIVKNSFLQSSNIDKALKGIQAQTQNIHNAQKSDKRVYRTDRVEIGVKNVKIESVGTYMSNGNRLQILRVPEAQQMEPDAKLSFEILSPSERGEYTEEDALMNQYMKQYRLEGYFNGTEFVIDKSKPLNLKLADQVTQEELDVFRTELEKNGLGDDIDWRGVQEDFIMIGMNFGNADKFQQKTDYLASRYAVLKDRIMTDYSGDKQTHELGKLEEIYEKAKKEMADTYASSIGNFYEDLGQAGAASDMYESVEAVIDAKALDYEKFIAEIGDYSGITDEKKQWLKQDDGYMAQQLRNSFAAVKGESLASVTTESEVYNESVYSAADLEYAGVCADAMREQLEHPDWDESNSDEELGRYLAQQFIDLSESMNKSDLGSKIKELLKGTIDGYIEKFIDALDKVIDGNIEKVKKDSWKSGFYRTDYIDRNEVLEAFKNAVNSYNQ